MKMRAYLVLTTVLFSIVGIIHLMRFVLAWPAEVGTWTVPLSVSLVAVLICGLLAFWGANLARRM